mgnify:CR=1 FL=1
MLSTFDTKSISPRKRPGVYTAPHPENGPLVDRIPRHERPRPLRILDRPRLPLKSIWVSRMMARRIFWGILYKYMAGGSPQEILHTLHLWEAPELPFVQALFREEPFHLLFQEAEGDLILAIPA